MTVAVSGEKSMAESEKQENNILPSRYGCEIILEKTTLEQAKNSSFPSDAVLITYVVDGETYLDLTRGTRVRIFDMYHDTYGLGALKKINFGYGKLNPKLWGYQKPEKKSRR